MRLNVISSKKNFNWFAESKSQSAIQDSSYHPIGAIDKD